MLTSARDARFIDLVLRDNALLRGLRNAKAQLKAFGADVTALGRAMAQMSIAAALPFALATKRFADFDDKMREVKAVSQSNEQQFAKLTEKAKALGASTSFTAVEVAGLMAELGRAGFTADQIENMTGAVLDLARATSTDATLASGIMAASIRQFGLAAGDATRVADALTIAANKSFNTVENLGEALSYAGPVAADFNMSIEDTLAVLGALGNVGIQGSNAGTAVRRLLTLTGAEAKKLKGIFGVTFLDAAGNARPLVDVLDEVNEATKDMGTGERAAKFNEAFGLLGITGASAIAKNAVSVRELQSALNSAGGAAAKTAAEMDAGIGGAFRILLSAVEGVAIAIGEVLADEVTKAAKGFTKFAANLISVIKNNKALVVTVAKAILVVGGIGAALVVVGSAATLASMALGGVLAVVSALHGTFMFLGTAIGFALSPMGLMLAALVGGAVYWTRFGDNGRAAIASITKAIAPFADTITKTIEGIGRAMLAGNFIGAMKTALAGAFLVWAQFVEKMQSHFGSAIASIQLQWENTYQFLADLWSSFASGFSFTLGGMDETWSLHTGRWMSDWEGFVGELRKLWAATWLYIQKSTLAATESMLGILESLSPYLGDSDKSKIATMRLAIGLAKPLLDKQYLDSERQIDEETNAAREDRDKRKAENDQRAADQLEKARREFDERLNDPRNDPVRAPVPPAMDELRRLDEEIAAAKKEADKQKEEQKAAIPSFGTFSGSTASLQIGGGKREEVKLLQEIVKETREEKLERRAQARRQAEIDRRMLEEMQMGAAIV